MEEYINLEPAYDPKIEACPVENCELEEIFYHILGIIDCYHTSVFSLFWSKKSIRICFKLYKDIFIYR